MSDDPSDEVDDAVSGVDADRDAESDDGEGEGEDGPEHRAFWADEVADAIEARSPTEPIVIKGGVSPSGIPHLGHFNEIMRGYYVARVLRERGHEVRQVFTADDRDALRKVPRTLADADWNLVSLGEVDAGALGRNLGVPYTSIPDPFDGCDHDSYGDHFSSLLEESADRIGVPVEMLSNTEMYETGEFDDVVAHVLANADEAREVLSKYQEGVDDSYVPFMAQCSECGRLTTQIEGIDLDARTVDYVCSGLEAGGQQIDGCGHEGTATFREGKLPWRFEWPAQWHVLGVDFEPFGKDHAEGSWPSGTEIAETVLGIQPPVPMTYEWFTLNGEPLSSSSGNVVTVDEVLELLEPEVLRYFFVRNPKKAKDFDLSRQDQLVDEFDRFERVYFGEVEDETIDALAERAYPFVVDEVREERVRIPYTFAAVLGMTDDQGLRERMARNEGHITDDTPEWAVEEALARVEKARAWAERMDNEYNYRLQADLPEVDFDSSVEQALDALSEFVDAGHTGEEIQGQMYELPDEYGIETADFFGAGYRLFFDADSGPRLGEFLGELDREFVVRRLRREG
jgi:lysyl-tRNA synthetase class 1